MGLGGSLFLGGRPRPRLGGVAVGGSSDDCFVGVAQVEEAELTERESLSEASESELRLNFLAADFLPLLLGYGPSGKG